MSHPISNLVSMTSGHRTNTNSGHASDWLSASQSAMNVVTAGLTEAPFGPAIEAIDQYRRQLDATEALLIARRSQAGHSDRSTEGVIKQSGGISKGEAKRRTSRAAAIEKNPKLAKKLVDGDISTEQVDLIADASSKTDGLAAHDDELIDELSAINPDLGRAVAQKFVDDHMTPEERLSRYERQRKRRKAYKRRSFNGMSQLILEADDESIDSMFRSLVKRGDSMYRADGGRDVPGSKHPRTNEQRLFDAAKEKLLSELEVDVTIKHQDTHPDDEPTSNSTTTSQRPSQTAASSSARSPSHKVSQPRSRPGERPTMVFTCNLTDITNDPELLAQWEAELIGTGIVPTPVASYYRCISEFAGQIVNGKGEVLWHGRSVRHATPGQWVALVVRDRGCIKCGADAHRCEAHHLLPFSAPAKGETNIDNMVLMCVDCHHWVHETDTTIVWDPGTGTWQYRNARWEERAAKGPPRRRRPAKNAEQRPPSAKPQQRQFSGT